MRRREFITLLGGAAAGSPLAAQAQPGALPIVGMLNAGSSEGYDQSHAVFRQSLRDAGYVEGRNVTFELHWANNQYNRLSGLATDLVRRRVAVIVAVTTPSARAAKAATSDIPIVFAMAGDPVKLGLVASLNRPDGNMTGVSLLVSELVPKRLELLHEAVPGAAAVGFLANPKNPNTASDIRDVEAAAASLGRKLHMFDAATDGDFENAFATMVKQRVEALLVASDPFFNSRYDRLVKLSARHALPTMYSWREFAAAGGLMSYGNSIADALRQVAVYVARILQGEKASNLPVQQAVKVELVVNLKTAKALGIDVPLSLLGRADEVIE